MSLNKKESVTSDSIPDVLGTLDPSELRLKKDKLLQRRLKQNPDLKSKFRIGEQMITTVTFTSSSAFAIDKQYNLLKMMGAEIAGNWEFSDISSSSEEGVEGGSESFTITSTTHDNKLTNDYLSNYLMSGVSLDIIQNNDKEVEKENVVNSILEMGIDPAKMANLLLGESKVQLKPKKEAEKEEEPDSKSKDSDSDNFTPPNLPPISSKINLSPEKEEELRFYRKYLNVLLSMNNLNSPNKKEESDSESDVVDDVQSMLVKMLPMTKGLDLSPEKEQELKKHIDAAMSIMSSETSKTEAVDYPQFQFGVMIPRDDYADAIRVLNDLNIEPKTSFNSGDSSFLAFDGKQSNIAGVPKLTGEQVINILSDVGIAAVLRSGDEIDSILAPTEDEVGDVNNTGSTGLDPEDLVARTESILLGKKVK